MGLQREDDLLCDMPELQETCEDKGCERRGKEAQKTVGDEV